MQLTTRPTYFRHNLATIYWEWEAQFAGTWKLVGAGLGLTLVAGGLITLNPLIGLGAVLGLLLLVLMIPRPIWIVYFLSLALPLTGGLSRGAVVPFFRVSQLLVVLGFGLMLVVLPTRHGKTRLSYIDLAFFVMFLAGAVFPVLTLYYRGERINFTENALGQAPLQILLGPLQYYFLYRVIVAVISSEVEVRILISLTFLASIAVSVIGILQKLNFGPVRAFLEANYPTPSQGYLIPDVNQRITSTLQHYSGLGAYLSFSIITALAFYSSRHHIKISSVLLLTTILVDSLALLLTGTIAAWIGLVIGSLVVVLRSGRLSVTVALISLAGLAGAVLLFQPFIVARLDEQLGAGAAQGVFPQSIAFRLQLWDQIYLPAIGQHLVFGSGPTPSTTNSWTAEESFYLFLLLRGGIIYFLSYVLLLGIALVTCRKESKRKKVEKKEGKETIFQTVAGATFGILVAITVMNIVGEYFTYAGGTQLIWTFLAIVIAGKQLANAPAETLLPPTDYKVWVHPQTPAPLLDGQDGQASRALPPVGVGASASLSYKYLTPSFQLAVAGLPAYGRLKNIAALLDWHFVKESVLVGFGSTLARVLGLVFAVVLARFLTPSDFGYVRYALTIVGIITIASAAAPASISRFMAAHRHDPDLRDRYYASGQAGIALLLGLSLLVGLPVLAALRALDIGTLICIIGLTSFANYFALVRGLGNVWKMSLSYILTNVLMLLAAFLVLGLLGIKSAEAALVIYGLANQAPGLILELLKPEKIFFRAGLVSKKLMLELGRFAWPLILTSGAYTIWFGADLLLVESFTPQSTAAYAAAKTLSGAFIFIPTAITMVLMPRAASQDLSESKRYCRGALLVTLALSLVGALIVAAGGPGLIGLTFGPGYSQAYLPLLVLSIGMTFYALSIVLEGFIVGHGRPGLSFQSMLAAMLTTVANGFWLVQVFGSLGASLAFTAGAVMGLAVMAVNTFLFLRKSERQLLESQQQAEAEPVAV